MSTTTFIQQLYSRFLGRDADDAGIAYWLEQFDSHATNAAQASFDFINSPEFSDTVAPIARLYYATLDRIPDAEGLSYWVSEYQKGVSLNEICSGFMASSEFQDNYGDLSDDSAFLEQLYQNVLNRGADSDGLDYWLGLMNQGLSRVEVVDGFANSAEFSAAKSDDIQILLIYHGILGTQPTQTEIDAAIAADAPLSLITQLYINENYAGEAVPGLSSTGVVVDGYVSGATVFIDSNGDGILNNGEVSTTTDAVGNFDFGENAGFGTLVMSGGTDISTGQAFEGTMTAPSGSTVVNPLTTLITLLSQTSDTNIEQAAATVLSTLGLESGVDLLNYDPIAEVTKAGASSAEINIALAIQAVAVQINTLVSQTAALLDGAGVSADEAAAINTAYMALAEMIGNNNGTNNGPLDLSSNTIIKQVIENAATEAGADASQSSAVESLSGDAAQTIANINQAINDAVNNNSNGTDVLSEMAAVQIVAENIENEMEAGAETGDVSTTTSSTQGSSFSDAVDNAGSDVGDVDGDGDTDTITTTTTTTPASGGGGGGTPAPTLTFTVSHDAINHVVTFAGTATGDITISWNGDIATFSRGGISASTSVDYDPSPKPVITLAAGQTLSTTAAELNAITNMSIAGDGNLTLTGMSTIAELNGFTHSGVNGTKTYSISDTAVNLLAADMSIVNGAVNITVTDNATIAQAISIQQFSNTGSTSYSLEDTASALAGANASIVNGTVNITVTDNVTIAQATTIQQMSNSGSTSYSLEDTAAALVGANASILNGATNIAATDNATIAQATILQQSSNSGSTSYSIEDTSANLLSNGAAEPITSATTVIVTGNAAGTLSVADTTLLKTLTTVDSWSYSLSDTFANLTSSDGDNAIASAIAITATGDTSLTDAQHDALIAKTTANGSNTLTLSDAASITAMSSVENYILGDFSNSIILSDSGHNITGGSGDDSITNGAGIDTLNGGAGDDLFIYQSSAQLFSANSLVDTIDGGEANDSIAISSNGESTFAITATDSFANKIAGIEKIVASELVEGPISLVLNDNAFEAGITTIDLSLDGDAGTNYINTIDVRNETDVNNGWTLIGSSWNDDFYDGVGADIMTGGDGSDTFNLNTNTDDNIRDTIIYTEASDGSISGSYSGLDIINGFDLNAGDNTDDRIAIDGSLETLLDNNNDLNLQSTASNGIDGGNESLGIAVNDELTILLDTELEIDGSAIWESGFVSLIAELDEEIDFSSFDNGDSHLFVANFSSSEAALILYTDTNGDDLIEANDIQLLGMIGGINETTGMVAGDIVII